MEGVNDNIPNVDHDDDDDDDDAAVDMSDEDSDEDDDDDSEEDDDEDDEAVMNKLMSVLQHREGFPARQRKRKMVELARKFLKGLDDDIHEMVTDQRDGEEYDGLDSSRDTEAEVELALRFFPKVLKRKEGKFNLEYPINCLTYVYSGDDYCFCNTKAVSFVYVFAKVAIEFGLFKDKKRGGLLLTERFGDNTLCYLVRSDNKPQYHSFVDDIFLSELIRLRRNGLLKKEDVQEYNLVHPLVYNMIRSPRRFRFLSEWNPCSLLRKTPHENLRLYNETFFYRTTIGSFRSVLDAGLEYFPYKKGINILFEENNQNRTPFELACERHGRETVVDAVEETLARYSDSSTPLNVADAMMVASIDDNIHLDCVHFLVRRHPDVLINLLRTGSNNNGNNGTMNNGSNDAEGDRSESDGMDVDENVNDVILDDDGDDNDHDPVNSVKLNIRKRKRK